MMVMVMVLALWYSMMIVAIAHTTSRHTTSTTGTITATMLRPSAAMVTVGVATVGVCFCYYWVCRRSHC